MDRVADDVLFRKIAVIIPNSQRFHFFYAGKVGVHAKQAERERKLVRKIAD